MDGGTEYFQRAEYGRSRLQAPYKICCWWSEVELRQWWQYWGYCKYRLSLAEKFACTETTNKVPLRLISKSISEWQMTIVQVFHNILHSNYNRNNVKNKCNVLQSPQNHPSVQVYTKCLTKLFPGTKQVGTSGLDIVHKINTLEKQKIYHEASVWFILTTIWSLIQPCHFSLLYRAYSNLPSLKISEIWDFSRNHPYSWPHNLAQYCRYMLFHISR